MTGASQGYNDELKLTLHPDLRDYLCKDNKLGHSMLVATQSFVCAGCAFVSKQRGSGLNDIFLSYNREDAAVAKLYADAFSRDGLIVWWDTALRSGEAYDEVTEAALRGAKAVVVLWSPRSVVSRWVRAEATLADRAGTLLPVMIETCERPIMFELIQTADLSHWKGNVGDPGWNSFLKEVRRRIAGESDAPSPVELAMSATFKLPLKASIAVLPFTTSGKGDGSDSFADGIVEEISAALSQFPSLFVIASASSLTYRDTVLDLSKIGRELGVRYLLEGSVRIAGQRVRISVRLIDDLATEQIWADKFDGILDDMFELQDRVAMAAASIIDSTIEAAELRRAVTRPTSAPGTQELYWRASAAFRKWNPESVREAITLTQRVLELEPENTWAAALCGFCHATLFSNQWSDDLMASRTAALAHYELAMKHGGEDARVLDFAGATLTSVAGDRDTASRLVERALELNPGSASRIFWGGWNDIVNGNMARGLERFEGALRLNPRSVVRPFMITGMGICLLFLHRYDEAATILAEGVQQLPQYPAALASLTASLHYLGRHEDAAAMATRLQAAGGSFGVLAMMRNAEQRDLVVAGVEAAARSAVPT